MEVRWIPIEEAQPECINWDEDRQAFFSKRVYTFSPIHGQQIQYARLDDVLWPQPRVIFGEPVRTKGRTLKWGVSGNDTTVTHWMPQFPDPEGVASAYRSIEK